MIDTLKAEKPLCLPIALQQILVRSPAFHTLRDSKNAGAETGDILSSKAPEKQ